MKKNLIFLGLIAILLIVSIFLIKGLLKKEKEIKIFPKEKMEKIQNKKAVMIIAFRDFRDPEYFIPKEILEKAGVEIKTASNKMGKAIGAEGGDVEVDLLVSEINVSDFDAIIFVGGPGCLEALDNENSYRVAREAVEKDKVLAAICISPVILAKAGILNGKKATCWTDPLGTQAKILKEKGAIYEKEAVVVDGKIITANGPGAAQKFGEKILESLTK